MSCFLNRTKKFSMAACAILLSASLTFGAAAASLAPGASEDVLYRKAPAENGIPVVIKNDQVFTYSVTTKTSVPSAQHYPLPKGTLDYVVGKEITYKSSAGKTYKYRLLASGLRVESSDIKKANTGPKNNSITSMSVSSPNDGYTYVTLKMKQKVSYSVAYKADSFQILFHYTVNAPNSAKLSSNPMFTKASWEDQCKLTLTLAKKNGFMGYKAYYDKNGNLVFRFNNPPKSIKNAVIAIDAGHGGKDIGAPGTSKKWPEKTINLAIAKKLEAELKARGAKVHLLPTSGYERLQRVAIAAKTNPDILISVHCNSAPNKSATGTEVYYFYPYSYQLASYSAANVSKQMATNNRGARWSYYDVTRSTEFASVLVETGFMTNPTEYKKLVNSKYQDRVAKGIADSIEMTIKAASTGTAQSGGKTVTSPPSESLEEDEEEDEDIAVKSVKIDRSSAKVTQGRSVVLKATVSPSNATDKGVTWESSDESIATVNSKGVVVGHKTGSAKITVTTNDGGYTDTCRVTVTASGDYGDEYEDDDIENDVYLTSSSADDTGIALKDAGEVRIYDDYLKLYPSTSRRVEVLSEDDEVVKNADFTWKSHNASVATVDKYGVVTARREGTTKVTASGGGYSLMCDIEVTRTTTKVTSISLDKTSLTLVRNQTQDIKATLEPRNASSGDIVWSSSSSGVASVDSNGRVKGLRTGKATITARSRQDGNVNATCSVEVISSDILIDYIYFDSNTLEYSVGDEDQLYITTEPDNATATGIIWTSSNSRIVSVDGKGNIKALAKGTAVIKAASAADQSVYDECKITVY